MTLEKLNEHYDLKVRLEKAQDMLQSLRAAAYPGGNVLTGLPHTPGVKDKVGDLAAEIADISGVVDRLEAQIRENEAEILVFISELENEQIRTIFRLRYIRALTWGEVANVIGGGNSENSVKHIVYGFFSKSYRSGA